MLKAAAVKMTKDFLLPLIRRLTKKNLSLVYSSYEAALEDADGFNDLLLTKVIVTKGKKFAQNLKTDKTIDLTMLRTAIGITSVLKSNSLSPVRAIGAAAKVARNTGHMRLKKIRSEPRLQIYRDGAWSTEKRIHRIRMENMVCKRNTLVSKKNVWVKTEQILNLGCDAVGQNPSKFHEHKRHHVQRQFVCIFHSV